MSLNIMEVLILPVCTCDQEADTPFKMMLLPVNKAIIHGLVAMMATEPALFPTDSPATHPGRYTACS